MPDWGTPARPGDHQDAGALRPRARRRRVSRAAMRCRTARAARTPQSHEAAASRSMPTACGSIRKPVRGTGAADQMGGAGVLPRASTTRCPGCAGIAAPAQPDQAVLLDLGARALLFLRHRDLAAGHLLPHRPADPGARSACSSSPAWPAASGAAMPARRRCGPICSCGSSG